MRYGWGLASLLLLPAPARGASPESSFVQPTFALFGVSEHVTGAADRPEPLDRQLAMDVGLGLDGRSRIPAGWLDWSAFGLVHDPFAESSRGVFAAGRLRGSSRLGARWRLRIDDSARFQQRETGPLADFHRNELSIGLEHMPHPGLALGLRATDRRRSVSGDPLLGFDRQALLASVTWGRTGALWRAEAGPQRFSTETVDGWRMLGTLEWAARTGRWNTGVRATWIEPIEERPAGGAESALFTAGPAASPLPPMPPQEPPPVPTPDAPEGRFDVRSAAPREGLLGPSLLVDPLEGDDTDWDFGRRKQELVAVAGRSLGRWTLTGELRVERERGLDLLTTAGAVEVNRERFAARLHLRRALGRRWAVVAQGGWQRLDDNRAGYGYSRGVLSLGLELRP